MKKIRWLLAVSVICIIFATTFLLVQYSNNYRETGRFWIPRYVRDYAAAIGLPSEAPSFEVIVELFGEPSNIYFPDHAPHLPNVKFDGIEFVFSYDLLASSFGNVQAMRIYSPRFRFGRRQIGIESTRAEIERAYRRLRLHDLTEERGFSIVDGTTWLVFYLDENDKVERIDITFYGP